MVSLTPGDYQEWLKLRKQTLIIFFVQNVMIGVDVSSTFMTLWVYLKEVIKPDTPMLFYSIIFVSFFIPSIIFTGLISKIVDRSRNVRRTFFIINTLVVIGNVLYLLPYSPWILVISRFLAGTANALRSVMAGEVARSYPVKELSSKLSYLGMAYSVGYVSGPALTFLFKPVAFHIFSLKVTYLNIPGLYMAVSFFLIQVFSVSMLSNLSKIYDLKAETMEIKPNEDASIDNSTEDFGETTHLLKEDTSSMLKRMFSTCDTLLLIVLAFLQNYIQASLLTWCPLMVIERLNWPTHALGWINISVAIANLIPCTFLTCFPISNHSLFYIGVFAQVALLLCHISLTVQYYVKHFVVNILMWIVYCTTWVIIIIGDEVFIVGALAQMVSSKYQIFADGIRLTSYRIGAVAGFGFSALGFQRMDITSALHFCIIIGCAIMLIIRRRNMKHPTIII